ncbi:MAG: GGDEF domain-containing protein, partial [Acidobacteriota bacterium]|nr:GGDEF domain-containing protein [Acidobacteriota bacterium]
MELLTCRDDAERGRLLDLSRRLRPTELRGSMLLVCAALVGAPTFNVLSSLPTIPGMVVFWLLQRRLERFRRPELALVGSVALIESGLAVSIGIASGPRVYLLPILMLPLLLACISLPARMAAVLVAFTTVMMMVVGLGFDLPEVRAMPFALIYPAVVMIAGSGIAMVVAGLDVSTRGVAVLDPLTGLPNRMALRSRAAELEHQSRANGRPVALIVIDPDRFKAVNDEHGHSVGDEVLRQVGSRIRGTLRAGANAYRLGGEEFVVLIGDADVAAGVALAERVRQAVSSAPIEGLDVAISIGVAASVPGEAFSFGRLFGVADRALYEAKRDGGDSVRAIAPTALNGMLSGATGNGGEPAGGNGGATDDASRANPDRVNAAANGASAADALEAALANAEHPDQPNGAGDGSLQGGGWADRWAFWNAKEHAATGNWLVSDDLERRQLLELNRRLRERAKAAFILGFAAGGASAIQYGWPILVPTMAMAVAYVLTEHHIERFRHPEYALGLAWLGLEASFVAAGLMANAPMIFAAPLLLMLLIGSSAVFPPRGVAVGVAFTIACGLVVGLAEDLPLVEEAPGIIAFYIVMAIVVGMNGVAVGRSTIDYRDLAIVDQLTGLFNRGALVARVAELAHRSADARAPAAVIVLDIDRFKAINDTHGHAAGDAVLKGLGGRVREGLRAFESAYRIGGEEFVVLLDEVDWSLAEGVATRLCEMIGESPIAGVPTTVSVGIAASAPGESFDYESV